MSTGDELVDLYSADAAVPDSDTFSGVFDTNRPSLMSLMQGLGYEVVDLGIAKDTSVKFRLFCCMS